VPAGRPWLLATKRDGLAVDENSNGQADPGDFIAYTIIIRNVGTVAATNVILQDTPDTNTSIVPGMLATTQGSVVKGNVDGDTTFQVNVGTLPAGGTATINLLVAVKRGISPNTRFVSNQGVVLAAEQPAVLTDDPDTSEPDDPTRTILQNAPDLRLLKSGRLAVDRNNDGVLGAGDDIEYEIQIRNLGTTAAHDVKLIDNLDEKTTLLIDSVSVNGSAGQTVVENSRSISTNVGTIPPGAVVTVRYRATVAAVLPVGAMEVRNQALLSGGNFAGLLSDDPSTSQVNDPTVLMVVARPKLSAQKQVRLVTDQDNNGLAGPGDILVYKITIINQGNTAASEVAFTDLPDKYTRLVNGSVQSSQGAVASGNNPGESQIRVSVGTLAAGAEATISYRVIIANALPAELLGVENQGQVLSRDLPAVLTDNPETREMDDPTLMPVSLQPQLAGTKEDVLWQDADGSGNVSAGDVLLYKVELSNRGTSEARDVIFADTPDPNTRLQVGTVQSSQGTVQQGNSAGDTAMRIAVGNIPAGGLVQISYAVQINTFLPPSVTQLRNQATVQGSNFAPFVTNDPDTPVRNDVTGTFLGQTTMLDAYKSATLYDDLLQNTGIDPSDVLLYRIEVLNLGNEPATGVFFRDLLSPYTRLVNGSVRTSLGTVIVGNNPNDTEVVIAIDTIPGNTTVTVSFLAQITAELPDEIEIISNQGTVSSDSDDDIPTDDPDTPVWDDPTKSEMAAPLVLYLPLIQSQIPTTTPTPTATPTPTPVPSVSELDLPCPPSACGVDGLLHPKGIAVHEAQQMIYMVSRDTDTLIKFNPATNSVVATAQTGDEPWDVVINEGLGEIYVSNYGSGDVWVYDANSLAVKQHIQVGPNPAMMEIFPAVNTVAVIVRGYNAIAIIENGNRTQLLDSGGVGPYGIAADSANNHLLVTNRDTGNAFTYYRDTYDWKMDPASELKDFGETQRTVPFEVAYNPNNQRIYITFMKPNGQWFVDVFEKESTGRIRHIVTVPVGSSGSDRNPDVGGSGLVINPETNNLFVADTAAGTVTVIGPNNTVIATVPVGTDPFEITVNQKTQTVYVTLRAINRLAKVVDTFR